MATLIRSFILALSFTFGITAFASDLEKFAKEVPTAEIDNEMLLVVQKEIGPDISITSSHYTLAKYIRMENNDTWFILDGYYLLSNEKIVMLDWVYNPAKKTKRPIRNYGESYDALFLGSHLLCNPYKRFWLYPPHHKVTRAKPKEGGVDKIYANAKGCEGNLP